jgi:hypothetical protein
MSTSSESGSGFDPFGPEPPRRSQRLAVAATASVGLLAVVCYVGQRVIAERAAEALRPPVSSAVGGVLPTPETVLEIGGEGGASIDVVAAELNRDHRIESATAAVELSSDMDGSLVLWLVIEAAAEVCSFPQSEACGRLVNDIAWIALLNYEPLDQLEGIEITVGEESTYRYTIAAWRERLDFGTPEP